MPPTADNRVQTLCRSALECKPAETTTHGYWLRRDSDRSLIPAPFGADDVRREA
jgi:hypothetical protein